MAASQKWQTNGSVVWLGVKAGQNIHCYMGGSIL